MDNYLVYALKVFLLLSICYTFFWATLRKSTYFSLNRAYLLCTLVLGFVVPLIMLPVSGLTADTAMADIHLAPGSFLEPDDQTVRSQPVQSLTNNFSLLTMTYAVGVLVLLVRSVLSTMLIWRIRRNGVKDGGSKPTVIRIRERMSFSFINTIVLQESAGSAVYLHEKGHVVGRHWVDLIMLEFVCILCWANPIVWLYRKSLRQQHEYLADRYVLQHGVPRQDYLMCILDAISYQQPVGPVHRFNSQSLKQRISMITQDQYSPYKKVAYIAIVPLVAFLSFSFSGRKDQHRAVDVGKVFVIDAAHGGDDAGSVSVSGISEKKVALTLAKLIREVGKDHGLNIQLTRTTDEELGLQKRVDFAAAVKADVFLSLHFGFETSGVREGAEFYISEENKRYADSKRMVAVLSKAFTDIKELSSSEVRSSNAAVLRRNDAASVILEVGYLSNQADVAFISDDVNQRKIAEKIVSAFMEY